MTGTPTTAAQALRDRAAEYVTTARDLTRMARYDEAEPLRVAAIELRKVAADIEAGRLK